MELFNTTALAAKSGISYERLRPNLLARPDKVKLTKDERVAIIACAREGLKELESFLSHE
jgi:hypothetical protein